MAPPISGALFDIVSSLPCLRAAWLRVEANQGAAGGDGVSIERFAHVAEAQLELLSRHLRHGHYRPGPARRVYVPKKSGGIRPLDIPCVIDRVAQAAAALTLDPILDKEMEDSSFAYRRGRSVARAVARVASLRRAGFTHVVDGDIRRYFENIPHERLIGKLERHVDDPALVDLIWLWLESYSLTGRGVPQGSPISPLLANLYLDSVDEAIASAGVQLVRFADDFILLTRSPEKADDAMRHMAALLRSEGLELNPEKSRLVTFSEGFRFLGHIFVRSMVMQEVSPDETPSEDAIEAAEQFAKEAARAPHNANTDEQATQEKSRHARRLFPVYVIEPGRRLEARGERLRLLDEAGRVIDLPPARINRIELGPDTEATLEALDLAIANDIDIVRINARGDVVARYETEGPTRARLHLAQAAMILDPDRRLAMAKTIVKARIHNQRALLRRLNRDRKHPDMAHAAQKIGRTMLKLGIVQEIASVMGVEGEASALFWPAFGQCFPEPFRFSRRTRKAEADAGNLVINVLVGILARDLRAMALRAGLHPGMGALHSTRNGEDALIYDIIEEFRSPIAEACASALFNRQAVDHRSFTKDASRLRLTRDGWAAVIRGYEAWVARPVKSPRSDMTLNWRGVMLEQFQLYADVCVSGSDYRAYAMDY
ncbi:CRISPR-associated endonuclease Cas1 [Rhabdaerophilum sp. SD176]|uniref:CRISPR-associated endonuclease Cas1 n=1 Tax=Rhabdaerophilum sp. SD176 TaxID=2983548 RepID=UPI0024E025E4|nr:CRISPR-associated endonuclease Cas1 [Rhabdaerophilum sp. SD176]